MIELVLAGGFPAATRDQWADLVGRVLKGADFDRKLVAKSYDGLRIEPLYSKSDRDEPAGRAIGDTWRVAQRIDHPDPADANALALADLEGGADALAITFAGAAGARGFGLEGTGGRDLERALDGVMLDLVSVRLDAGGRGRKAARSFVELAERRGHRLADLDLDLGMDPVGALASGGAMAAEWPAVADRVAATLGDLAGRGFVGRAILADGRPYHDAGGSEAQELAGVLATALLYLRALEERGHALDAARATVSFLLAADADEFLTIAKFRALRRLWARVEAACGLEPKPLRLHAETSWRMATRRSPFVNILRGTMASFSAAIGGADIVSVLPFTAALGLPDAFARRIARNTQLILLEEANLWRVHDPVAGSGGIEAMTGALAAEAWAGLQQLEREGGIVASLRAGAIQARIAATRGLRERAVATRRDAITGTSEFPDLGETPVTVLSPVRSTHAATSGESGAVKIEPLVPWRVATAYEALRDAAEAAAVRPTVFLANLGTPADFTPRATFAKNAFEAGGIAAVGAEGYASTDSLASAFAASGARLACLCSSEDVYALHAVGAAGALTGAGADKVFLAGRPGSIEGELRDAGVTDFVFAGCDLLALLRGAIGAAGGEPPEGSH